MEWFLGSGYSRRHLWKSNMAGSERAGGRERKRGRAREGEVCQDTPVHEPLHKAVWVWALQEVSLTKSPKSEFRHFHLNTRRPRSKVYPIKRIYGRFSFSLLIRKIPSRATFMLPIRTSRKLETGKPGFRRSFTGLFDCNTPTCPLIPN